MSKGVNLATQELKNDIIEAVNKSGLPPVLVKYAMNDVLKEVLLLEQKAIKEENEAYKKEESEG